MRKLDWIVIVMLLLSYSKSQVSVSAQDTTVASNASASLGAIGAAGAAGAVGAAGAAATVDPYSMPPYKSKYFIPPFPEATLNKHRWRFRTQESGIPIKKTGASPGCPDSGCPTKMLMKALKGVTDSATPCDFQCMLVSKRIQTEKQTDRLTDRQTDRQTDSFETARNEDQEKLFQNQ